MFDGIFDGTLINKILGKVGLKLSITFNCHLTKNDKLFLEIYEKCKPFTLTSIERMYSLYKAVEYVENLNLPGDMVECGAWKGGSAMLMAYTLLTMKSTKRKIYLYDTFKGMSRPTDKDVDFLGKAAIKEWKSRQQKDFNTMAYAHEDEVRRNLYSTGYPQDKLIFVVGKVEDTIPGIIPEAISILRLDTDWYESTYHELSYLFPLLSLNGVLIIDDYDFYRGQREVTDRYLSEHKINILLHIVDGAGRIGIKIGSC